MKHTAIVGDRVVVTTVSVIQHDYPRQVSFQHLLDQVRVEEGVFYLEYEGIDMDRFEDNMRPETVRQLLVEDVAQHLRECGVEVV